MNTFIRGTLRYRGFNEIVGSWMDLGLINKDQMVSKSIVTWWQLLLEMAAKDKYKTGFQNEVKDIIEECASRNGLRPKDVYTLVGSFISDAWKNYSKSDRRERVKIILEGYEWFGLLDVRTKLPTSSRPMNTIEILAAHLEKTLSMGKGEADLIIMVHFFEVFYPHLKKTEVIKSSMVKSGTPGGLSGMALTVGYPLSISVRLILEVVIKKRGV